MTVSGCPFSSGNMQPAVLGHLWRTNSFKCSVKKCSRTLFDTTLKKAWALEGPEYGWLNVPDESEKQTLSG
ncbi:hypothetical protein KDA_70990 [Dictyobacter alpinus]|uniref:Uncharacterized protein n=1 Tax=Dictyobacter alpinus TaxID=2014873 RepID=A0A402BJV2_9CHLR|nr:hypothetical protein KDA_70990 [Dictyobacter alpinus]